MLGELPADSASLSGPQVQRLVLLPLKKGSKWEKWLKLYIFMEVKNK